MVLAEQHGLFVIEDAAQAFGATYKGRKAPGLGHVGATSFFPAKPLGCYGDGGAIFTDDDDLAEKIRSLVVHGKGEDKYNNVRIGLNARIDTMQAAILIEKLKIYDDELMLRQKVADFYADKLRSIDIVTPATAKESSSVWAQYTVRTERRAEVQAALQKEAVPSVVYYVKPMHMLDAMAYLGYQAGDFPAAETAAQTVLSLPMHPYLAEADQLRIVAIIKDVVS